MCNLKPEYNVELEPKEHLVRALKTIVKVSEYADQEEKMVNFAKFCFLKEPKMTSARYYIDAEHTEFNVQMGITICVKDFDVLNKRTKAPKYGAWIRLSELNDDATMNFIEDSGASWWVNVLAVRVDDDVELDTASLCLTCIKDIYDLYIGNLTKDELKNLSGIAGNRQYNSKLIKVTEAEAKNWYICPIAEDVEQELQNEKHMD